MRNVYFDHAATTRVDPDVIKEMVLAMDQYYGNPSSIHQQGREAKKLLDTARGQVAQAIHAKENEILFTSGGTESDNLALWGVAKANEHKGRHIITSAVEHHAILHTCQAMERQGWLVTYLPVDEMGIVSEQDLHAAIRPDTVLASIMMANNETGTIQPIAALSAVAKQAGVLFHTDAVQAFGSIPVHVDELGADLLTISSHKIYGPKGIGALYVRKGVRIVPLFTGGSQEGKKRAGTENIPGIVGFGKAAQLACAQMEDNSARLIQMREAFIQGVFSRIDHVRLNGHPTKRLPGNVNISVEFAEGEALLLNLDLAGISASSGSACTSGSLEPSHVLLAMGLSHEIAHGSLRFTIGRENTMEDVDYTLEQLASIIKRIRAISPLHA